MNRLREPRQVGRPASRAGKRKLYWAGLGGAVMMLTGLALWHHWWQRDGGTLDRARQAGVIRIGYAVEAPYSFLTPEGRVTGEAPEIARVIAKQTGITRVEWRLTEFDDLIADLEAGRFDVIAAGMFITTARLQQVLFSRPTFQVGAGLLVRKSNPLAIHSYANLLQRTNARIAVLSGSIEESHLLQIGCPEARLVRVPDAWSGREAISSGAADALALSAPTLRWMQAAPNAGDTELAEPFEPSTAGGATGKSLGGFAFRRNDRALCAAWDQALNTFIGSAEHRRLVRTFGFTEAEIPVVITDPERSADSN